MSVLRHFSLLSHFWPDQKWEGPLLLPLFALKSLFNVGWLESFAALWHCSLGWQLASSGLWWDLSDLETCLNFLYVCQPWLQHREQAEDFYWEWSPSSPSLQRSRGLSSPVTGPFTLPLHCHRRQFTSHSKVAKFALAHIYWAVLIFKWLYQPEKDD